MKLKRTNENRKTLSWLFARTKGQRFKLLILIFSNIVMAGLSVSFALICKGLVDGAVAADKGKLIRYAVYLLAVILGQILLSFISGIINERATANLAISMQDEMLGSFLKNKYSEIIPYHSGELLNRMFSDVSVVVGGMIQLLPSASYLFFRLTGAAAVLVALSPRFTLLFLAAGVLICIVMTLMRKKIKTLHKEVQQTGGKVRSYLQEALTGLLVIRAFGAETQVRNKTLDLQENYRKARFKRRFISMLAGMGFDFIFQMGYFLAMVWGCTGIFQGTLTYGTLTAMLQLVNQIQSPFAGFSGLISQYYTIIASAERIIEIENLPEEVIDTADRDEYYKEAQLDYI